MTSSDLWDAETAERYDESSSFMFAPDVLEPAVDFLAELAGAGAALELAIGTGRVAVPLTHAASRSPASSCPNRWSPSCAARPPT
ncbi:hypothetical protein [Terrabacter sp. NPDC080008]|uniref:hypothetical protein n=1 Tax=Terrabacter sp. NPDC080008 TaxID=3155176 RepID=UPI00344CFB8C